MGSLFDTGGYIGSEGALYPLEYNDSISGSSGGTPDFRWTLSNTTAEVGGHTTTVNGSFSYTNGIIPSIPNNSADFNGADSYLQPANDSLINVDTGSGYFWTKRSVSLWFNADDNGSDRCLWEEGGGVNWFTIYFNGGLVYANLGEGSATQGHATAAVSSGTTYHLLVTVDLTLGSNQIKIYLNGELAGQASSSVGGDLAAHSGDNRIGFGGARNHTNTNNPFTIYDGRMQDFCYWHEKALTLSDAQNIYNSGIDTRPRSGIYSLKAVLEAL